jgi:hypothetical protein
MTNAAAHGRTGSHLLAALARAKRLVPNLQGELISHASHDMSYSRHQVVDALILHNFAQVQKGAA